MMRNQLKHCHGGPDTQGLRDRTHHMQTLHGTGILADITWTSKAPPMLVNNVKMPYGVFRDMEADH